VIDDHTTSLINKYANKGILVDTNLLLLLLVGLTEPSFVPKFRRTEKFAPEDCKTLENFLSRFDQIFTLPNVLTEVSNLAGQIEDKTKKTFDEIFCKFIRAVKEEYVPSYTLTEDESAFRFGLTDCAIMALVTNKYLLLGYFRPKPRKVR